MRVLIETFQGVNIYKEGDFFLANVFGEIMYESSLHDMRMTIMYAMDND